MQYLLKKEKIQMGETDFFFYETSEFVEISMH